MTDRSDLAAALRKQIGMYKQARMFTDDLKGNALLAVLNELKDEKHWRTHGYFAAQLLDIIAREMQTKENGFLD